MCKLPTPNAAATSPARPTGPPEDPPDAVPAAASFSSCSATDDDSAADDALLCSDAVGAGTVERANGFAFRATPASLLVVLLFAAAFAFSSGIVWTLPREAPENWSLHLAGDEGDVTSSDHRQNGGYGECHLAGGAGGPRLPSGSHLSVDVRGVDSSFLGSEERLWEATMELVDELELTLLSRRCNDNLGVGASCIGVLAASGASCASHVAFHTWPDDGAIALDVYKCGGAEPLVPLLPRMRELFAVAGEPSVAWSHKLRGFRDGFARRDRRIVTTPLETDLGTDMIQGFSNVKAPLISARTDFQRVDVYEEVDPRKTSRASYERSLTGDGSYEARNPQRFRPNKVLFLDGVEQSNLYGDAAYHEALVVPAMLAHPNPKRVAIIGGGEGATLREVLKFNAVDEVVMVEIDEELVDLCEEHLPEWTDCTDNAGSDAESCFDDSRARLVFEDAFRWFVDNFGVGDDGIDDKDGEETEKKFDVIVMDALDPQQMVDIVGRLYKDNEFVASLFNGLTDDGVFVMQIGETDYRNSAALEVGRDVNLANMMDTLQDLFQNGSMHIYDEGHSHFAAPWSYLVSFKNAKSRASWYLTSAEIELELRKRLHGTISGENPLLFFDASTMMSYQLPTKAHETRYCKKEVTPWECKEYAGIDPRIENIPLSHLEARKSTVGQHAGRGLFAMTNIPEGSALDMKIAVAAFHVLPSTLSLTDKMYDWADSNYEKFAFVEDELFSIITFTFGYGYGAMSLGKMHYTVDSGITNFCNHGCNGTYNYGYSEHDEAAPGLTEMTVDLDRMPDSFLNRAPSAYSPVYERHWRQALSIGDCTNRAIEKGEEVLCNYLYYVGDPIEWKNDVTGLRGQCAGNVMGDVASYETMSDAK